MEDFFKHQKHDVLDLCHASAFYSICLCFELKENLDDIDQDDLDEFFDLSSLYNNI